MRGLAALGVVVYHHGSHFHVWPLPGLLNPLYEGGWRAVDFFFALSGFVLARAYWTEARRHRLGSNIWDRVARLYPLHLATLLLVAAGQWDLTAFLHQQTWVYHLTDTYHFVLNLLLIQGLDSSFNGPSWSISTEFVVNILFFCAILLPRRAAMACFVVAIVAVSFTPSEGPVSVLVPLARTLRGFCLGVLLHSAVSSLLQSQPKRLTRGADAVFVCATVLWVVYAYLPAASALPGGPVTLLLSSALIASAPISGIGRYVLNRGPLVYLGEISYSIYLIHFPLQLVLWLLHVRFGLQWSFGPLAGLVVFLAATVGCADLTYRFIELPGKSWLRPRRKRAPAGSNVPVSRATSGSRTDGP